MLTRRQPAPDVLRFGATTTATDALARIRSHAALNDPSRRGPTFPFSVTFGSERADRHELALAVAMLRAYGLWARLRWVRDWPARGHWEVWVWDRVPWWARVVEWIERRLQK